MLTPRTPEEDGHSPGLTITNSQLPGDWRPRQENCILETLLSCSHPAPHAAYTNLLQALSTPSPPSSLPGQVQNPWGADTGMRGQSPGLARGRKKLGPRADQRSILMDRGESHSSIAVAHCSRVGVLQRSSLRKSSQARTSVTYRLS